MISEREYIIQDRCGTAIPDAAVICMLTDFILSKSFNEFGEADDFDETSFRVSSDLMFIRSYYTNQPEKMKATDLFTMFNHGNNRFAYKKHLWVELYNLKKKSGHATSLRLVNAPSIQHETGGGVI